MNSNHAEVLNLIGKLATATGERDDKLFAICSLIKEGLKGYDWVGIYVANPKKRTLRLGPYVGAPTEHVSIPYGKGICGQVAESQETLIVPDVGAQENYLACSINVKSEIVVPIFKDCKFVAQLDVDSHLPDNFTKEDKTFLESVGIVLAPLF